VSLVVGLLASYALGAEPVGLLVGRAFGVRDIRRRGSGNIGATNVLRTAGWPAAVLTLTGDVAKGYLAVLLGAWIAAGDPTAAAGSAVAAVVGNCWPVFLRFRGGKGVATGLGAFLRLLPWATLPAAVVWLAVTATFRYVSLGSLTATVCVPLGALMLGEPVASVVAALVVAAIIVLRHRDNMARLLAGTERRLGGRTAP
jgi:glycerol-3-phosphate acyltransferase PlsY